MKRKALTRGQQLKSILLKLETKLRKFNYTVVTTRTFTSVKPAISPSNVAQNANSGTVLDSACPEDSKTPPTC